MAAPISAPKDAACKRRGFDTYSCFAYSNPKTKQVMVLFITNGKYKRVKSLAAKALNYMQIRMR